MICATKGSVGSAVRAAVQSAQLKSAKDVKPETGSQHESSSPKQDAEKKNTTETETNTEEESAAETDTQEKSNPNKKPYKKRTFNKK